VIMQPAPIAGNYQLIVIHRFGPRSLRAIAFAGMKVSFGVLFGSQSKSKTKFASDAVNGLSLLRHGSEKGPTANVPTRR
jgi:hypothetical protein